MNSIGFRSPDLIFITPIAAFLAEHEKAAVVISPAITTSYPPRREPRRHPPPSSSIPLFFLGPQSIFLFLHHRFIISAITDVPASKPGSSAHEYEQQPSPSLPCRRRRRFVMRMTVTLDFYARLFREKPSLVAVGHTQEWNGGKRGGRGGDAMMTGGWNENEP